MSPSAFPASGSTNWYGWAQDVDNATLRGVPTQVSPATYGLVADGVTDAAPGINAMGTTKHLTFGGVLLCKGPLKLQNQQQLEGLGRYVSSIKFDPTAFSASVALPTISSITADGTYYTITFASAHGRSVDDVIELYGAIPDNWNDQFQVVNVVSSTVLKVPCPYSPGAPTTMPSARTVNALVIFGPGAGLVFGTRLQNLTIDCQSIPDSIGVFGEWWTLNEQAGLSDVLVTHATYRGTRLKSAQYQYENVEIIMAPPANPVTSVASGSNNVDLASSSFYGGTGVINIPAGDIAAQGIPWAGSVDIAITGTPGYRVAFYRGTSAGTGPSGQDQLLNVQTATDVSRVMATGQAITVANVIGEDLTVGYSGSGNTQEFGRATVVTSHSALMRAATRVNGPGNIAVDGHHTEYAHAGLVVGDRQGVKALTVKNFSCASSHIISAAILRPADGSTNSGYTLLGTSGDGSSTMTIMDVPNNAVLMTSANHGVAQYPVPLTGSQPLQMYRPTLTGLTPSATANTPGASQTFSPPSGKTSIMPVIARIQATTIGTETITVNITANYADGTSGLATQITTTNTSLVAASNTQMPNLWKDGTYAKSYTVTVQSSIASSTAQVNVMMVGYTA